MSSRKMGVVMDPIDSINPIKDSTLAIMLAAQRMGWQLTYIPQGTLYSIDGESRAIGQICKVFDDSSNWYSLESKKDIALASLDVILMRKDPPFDSEYIYSTYLLEAAERCGVLVVNKPQSLRDCNEKVFATQFPACCPPVLISSSAARIRDFYDQHQDVILKPLDGMGGASIFRVKPGDHNLNVIIETLTHSGRRSIMVQRFIPEISAGDKRVLMVNGEPVPLALARVPAEGENRGNLAAGGSGIPQPLSDRDRWIAEQVGPSLKEKGLLFVGLDIIGDYLTEINVTSPTCIRELDKAGNFDIGGQLIEQIEATLQA
ncbi:glutathione synthase [bacterium]|nr:glutathione synthase [bacterium]